MYKLGGLDKAGRGRRNIMIGSDGPDSTLRAGFAELVCPITRLPLTLMARHEAELKMGGSLFARPDLPNSRGTLSRPAGVTDLVMVRSDLSAAFPIVDEVPILLAPEILAADLSGMEFDLTDPKYAEAYEEMDFYNARAVETAQTVRREGAGSVLPTEMAASDEEKASFPRPWERWIDAVHDLAAQSNAYEFLSPVKGRSLLQLGGSGTHAVKFAMAGAAEVWLATPMAGEAVFATALAGSAGFGDRFRAVVAIGEELPFGPERFYGIFSGGSLHHMMTEHAFPEAARVLKKGGRFAAAEPWRAPLYRVGTLILGKREDAYCRPLDPQRLEPLSSAFSKTRIIRHGALTRYPLIGLEKLGLKIPKSIPWYFGRVDDAVASLVPGLRRMGSSIAVLAEK